MKRIISILLAITLLVSGTVFSNSVQADEEISDKDIAIAVIDNLIVELKELGYGEFYQDKTNVLLSDSYLWIQRYNKAVEDIKINNKKASYYTYSDSKYDYYYNYINQYYWIGRDESYNSIYNSYYYYLSALIKLEEVLEQGKVLSISEIIEQSKTFGNNYNSLEYYLWARNTNQTISYIYQDIYNSYLNQTFRDTYYDLNNYLTSNYGNTDDGKATRLDNVIKCLELINEELNNPFMYKVDVSVSISGNTQYDQYKNNINVKTDITPSTNTNTSSKSTTNSGNTTKTVTTTNNKSIKLNGLKLTAKKGKIKVSFAKLQNATSYEIQISTNKKFKKAKTYTVNKTSKTIKNLKRKKIYYVRVRAISGNTKSKWVKKKIKTK